MLLAQYAPPGIVTDARFRIVELRGNVERFLAGPKEAGADLFAALLWQDLLIPGRRAEEAGSPRRPGPCIPQSPRGFSGRHLKRPPPAARKKSRYSPDRLPYETCGRRRGRSCKKK